MDSIMRFEDFPGPLRHAEHVLPDRFNRLYMRGQPPPDDHRFLTVVGSRRNSEYGKEACEALIRSLAGLPVVIVSGLALGIDSVAHRAALESGIQTIAVPGSGLGPDALYPASHASLAHRIVESSGALVSPFPPRTKAAPWTFPTRNRLMAALSHAVLIVEATLQSGTLITAKHAVEFNRDVLAVPGPIFSPQSAGPHLFIRTGATPVACGDELREALGFGPVSRPAPQAKADRDPLSLQEGKIIDSLSIGPLSRERLFAETGMSIGEFNAALSMLEIRGAVKEIGGVIALI